MSDFYPDTTASIPSLGRYVSRSYTQCGGTATWGSVCDKCGAEIGTGGVCIVMIKLINRKEAIEAQRRKRNKDD